MSINRVIISGNLTRDPEVRATASQMPVLAFGIAVNDRRRNASTGEWEDYPNFIDCTMFGNRAESLSRFLHKGSKVCVEGKLRYSSWERDGQKRSKIEVIVDELELLSARSDGNQGGYAPAPAAAPVYQPQQAPVYQPQAAPAAPAPVYGGGAPVPPAAPTPVAPSYPDAGVIDTSSSAYDDEIPF